MSIVGPSGCGKSTLLAHPGRAARADRAAGSGSTGGRPAGLLGRVGYMPQRDLLMQWRTTLENATLGLELAGVAPWAARAAGARRARALRARGLRGTGRPSALSGGMRQRAALLRTFLAGRDVLLLDEPFGALDALTREAMREWLLGVWEADRKTILLVTHDVEEAVFLVRPRVRDVGPAGTHARCRRGRAAAAPRARADSHARVRGAQASGCSRRCARRRGRWGWRERGRGWRWRSAGGSSRGRAPRAAAFARCRRCWSASR